MDIQVARVTLKKKQRKRKRGKTKKKTLKKGKIKKEAFPYESSIGEIRLMTRPCIRSRHVTVQISFGQAR